MTTTTEDPRKAAQAEAYKKILDALECPTPTKPVASSMKWGQPCPDLLALPDYPGDLACLKDGLNVACIHAHTHTHSYQGAAASSDTTAKSAGRK